ncbi:MAG: hypothetical protein IPO02_09530 [Bacteroidetes bacterium]|nr:hypothetical protein [Bacteroidota bacterium]
MKKDGDRFFQAGAKVQRMKNIGFTSPPATLSFANSDDWHLWVDNPNAKEVSHIAIDDCLGIPRAEGERCESMITYDNVLTFIELKDRDGGRWAGKARDQLLILLGF